jgi:hypothetical protein
VVSDSPPNDDEVRWAYDISDHYAGLLVQEMMAEDDARLELTDEQIAFMNSAEVARARAICDRHQRACGVGPIDFDTGRRLPKHDLADMEAERPLC